MKEFFLGILKNIITYVAMIVIVIVGGISISTQKFPPKWGEVVSAVNTLKKSYASMLNLRQQMGGMMNMQQGLTAQVPDLATLESNAATSLENHEAGVKKPDANDNGPHSIDEPANGSTKTTRRSYATSGLQS